MSHSEYTKPPLASVIIVNWNGVRFLQECLESLFNQTFQDFELIIVDNASTDGSVEFIAGYPRVKLVSLALNTGFAAGNNIGFQNASGEYIVILNNDTCAEPDWLEKLVKVADANPGVGMIGCRTCVYGDKDTIDTIGGSICRDGMSRGGYRLRSFSELGLEAVEEGLYPSGCAALYKRAMLNETGFFDDDFFAYAEDTDLGLRGQLAGWKTLIVTNAIVHHKYSGTGGAFSPLKLYLVERNHYWVAIKNFPLPLLALLPFWTCVRYAIQFFVVLSGRGSGAEFRSSTFPAECIFALTRATRDALIGLPRQWQKRRRIYRRRRIGSFEMMRLIRRFRLSFLELLDYNRTTGADRE
ncbi:MAG TPA: glycosyltransferase family 2 protein [Desulfuromonadaceae bacterium]